MQDATSTLNSKEEEKKHEEESFGGATGITGLLVAPVFVFAVKRTLTAYPECLYCGMDRQKFAHSRILIEYEDDSEGFCSLHCAAINLASSLTMRRRPSRWEITTRIS